jgi:predicted SAM-dependent methyltransferase
MRKFLNLACGDYFINSSSWINCDFAPQSKSVKHLNLLGKFPFDSNSFDLVYCSHYLEHIGLDKVSDFMNQCNRVLKKNGVIRLVLPDFENIAREYVMNKDLNQSEFASFNIAEMIDQCVRTRSGGDLQDWYYRSLGNKELSEYIYSRTGFKHKSSAKLENKIKIRLKRITLKKMKLKLQLKMSYIVISTLPSWFKANHISKVATGERHFWVHDFDSVKAFLEQSGFTEVKRVSAQFSCEPNFPLYPLDLNSQNHARKGKESMYIEARKI